MIEISSKNNENIKFARKIITMSKVRYKEKLFAVEGTRLCSEVFENKVKTVKIFYTQKCYEKYKCLIDKILNKDKPEEYVLSESVMKYLSDTEAPQGIICLCEFIDKKVNITKIKSCSNIILLENLQNPSNLGSIFRSLNAFNIDLVVMSSNSCDIYNQKVLRGSMGAVFKLNIINAENFSEFILLLKNQGFETFATVPKNGVKSVTCLCEVPKKAVVMGNEGNGISNEILELCDNKVTIPMNKNCESLSVAVAAGIVVWEMSKKEEEKWTSEFT